MVDESWALSLTDAQLRLAQFGYQHAFSLPYYAGLCIILYLAWFDFTTLGALVGPVLGDIHYFGFDMPFPAIMLILLTGNWYVLIGALAGIAAAFWLIQEDEA